LIELALIGAMRALYFAIQARFTRLDIDVFHPEVFDMLMEFGLKFVAIIGPYCADTERKFSDDVINEG